VIFYLFFYLMVLWFSISSIIQAAEFVKEMQIYLEIRKNDNVEYSVIELLVQLRRISIKWLRVLVIRYYSQNNKLIPNYIEKVHLRNLIAFVDGFLQNGRKNPPIKELEGIDPEVAENIGFYPLKKPKFKKLVSRFYWFGQGWDKAQLDELCELSEQLIGNSKKEIIL
jgi:hypothetical protein